MSIRQQKYKAGLLQGKSRYESALEAGYSKNTALHHTAELDRRLGIDKVLEENGLTDSFLVAKHKTLLEATKVIGYLHQYKKGKNGEIERCEPDEAVSNEFLEVPDNQAIAKGLELAYKLKGHLKDKVEHSGKIEGGEARIYIINGSKEDNGRTLSNPQRIPEKISV